MTTNTAVNSNVSYSGIVEKYIGTAYDTVAIVANNIDVVLSVGSNMDELIAVGQIEGIENIEELATQAIESAEAAEASAVKAETAEFSINTAHLGGFTVPPVLDNNGNALVAGATYTDLTQSPIVMKQWDGVTWIVTYNPTTFIKQISDTPPIAPVSGTQWTDTTTMRDYTYYDDGDTSQWVRVQ